MPHPVDVHDKGNLTRMRVAARPGVQLNCELYARLAVRQEPRPLTAISRQVQHNEVVLHERLNGSRLYAETTYLTLTAP